MRQALRWSIVLAAVFRPMCGTAPAATQEQIGSWILNCPSVAPGTAPGTASCVMRANKRLFDKGGITGDLELQAEGTLLVPVIALRGVSSEMLMAASLASKTEASLQFPGASREDLTCAASSAGYICSPNNAAGQRLAAGLATARAVTVRVSVSLSGMSPLPPQERSLDLTGTQEALARLRAAGPSRIPSPTTALASQSPGSLMEMADKALKAAGYSDGMANIQALLAKYGKK